MGALRDRLAWDEGRGALQDGPRRYLMMRPDVLMGMLRRLPPEARAQAALRPVEVLVIAPSQRLDTLAARHVKSLPWPVRALLRSIGATNRKGSALASYLLFEADYTRALIDLGFRDTMARQDEVLRFLAP